MNNNDKDKYKYPVKTREHPEAGKEDFLLDEEGMPPEEYQDFKHFASDGREEEEEEEEAPGRSSKLIRIVALITVLAFIGLVVLASWPELRFPVNDLVVKSLQLKKDTDPRLLEAVVKVNVIAGGKGSSLHVEQRNGTGFNISPEGLIVTNHHVIEGAEKIAVRFSDGTLYNAQKWHGRKEYDLAVIVLDKSGLPCVPLNEYGGPAPGDKIKVIGNPLGLNNIVSEGRVGRYVKLADGHDRVFTIDAPIYPGNSGSPVYNTRGEVVGVVFATADAGEDNNIYRVGLAVPVKQLVNFK